ncbi:KAT8 regulatory NSL complex subunit 1-like isoform X2 [Pristis pectinata]|uniref:KAT8 regulatory NSL complex subunit 1-like isoform X2 n=1 Tax=Pristis pectinata TaxID=685728 RepID=UPI00223DB2DB|nr:KAT8 regulatory NSL complex subunit 1-like isoform X2 [Pristis pectinata]
MAAMAPALTEAATEAHRRFKLATPSSSLSPSGTTDTDNSNSINNSAKRKAFAEDHSLDFRNNSRKEDQCKLLSPRCCFDGGSRPPPPESVKLQGSLSKHGIIKSHTVLSHSLLEASVLGSDLIDGQVAVEFSPKLIKTMNAGNSYPSLPPSPEPPVNGLAKKSAGNPHSDYDLNVAKTGRKTGSSQAEDFNKLVSIMSSKITKEDVAGEPRNFKQLSTVDEDLQASEFARHLELGEKGIENTKVMSSPEVSDGISGSTDSARDLSASEVNTLNILDTEVHSRTLLAQTRQSEIRRRAYRLKKRLEVVQVKQVERHVQQQLGGFVEKTLHHLPPLDCLKGQDGSLQNDLVYGCKSSSISWKGDKSASETLENFFKSSSVTKGLEKFISSSDSKLRFSENAFDSDVTESSSGGESDIEEESKTKVETKQYLAPSRQCSEWRWAIERAAIVSRWNWLQAHVSDLEYRIRQQTDIYRQIRANKGSVVLGDVPPLEDLSQLPVCSPDRAECPSLIELKAHGTGGNVEMSVYGRSSLPRIAGKQVIPPVHPIENVTSSTPAESTPTKACCHSRPVNGVVNSVHSLLPDSNSADSSDAEERLNKKQRLNALPVSLNTTCTAARVRPLLTCKKRRLIRPNNIQPLNQKNQYPLTVKCNCNVTTSCIMCGSKNSESQENQYNMPMSERLALLDACLHPVLSFCDDIPLNMHLQPVLKGYPQNKSLDKSKASKKLLLKHKGLSAVCLSDPTRRAQQKLTNSILASAKYVYNKNRTEKTLKQHFDDLLSVSKFENANVQERFLNKRRQREPSSEVMEARPALSDMGSPYGSTDSCHTSSHGSLLRQLSSSESSAPSMTNTHTVASTLQAIRKRRGESSFDINNIVIPMSVAATTRVEKLQYKEILTPSWRVMDLKADLTNNRFSEEEHEEMEDLSDAAFSSRHTKYEEFERSRWTTWLASPVSAQRRGSRSYKSTDEHSTPQPVSPDVNYHSLGDLTLSGSPSSPSAPPVNPDTNYSPLSQEHVARISSEDTRCSTPDIGHEEQTIQPWEKRTFPLAYDPGTERESRAATGHRQTRNSRRSSGGSNRGSRELESGGLATVQRDDKQRHSVSLRLSHR